jgi:flagellar motility protein MotE (MotC chaperone)
VIITRQRKRRRNLKAIVIPLLIVAAIGFLIGFPPTARIIANSPLRPVWVAGAHAYAVAERPLTFAGQQATIADRNREIRDLNARLDTARQAKADADARASQLQRELAAANERPIDTPAPAARPRAAASPGVGTPAVNPADGRVAATWAAMEPEKAAALVQRMPEDAAVRVLAQMDTDSAGAILNALPPAVAARLSRAQAQVAAASGR